jgi:hypothetical protein
MEVLQMLLDCLRDNLSLLLAAIGIVLLGFVIAAVVAVLIAGTAGTAAAFVAEVAALLASWWIPITASILSTLALAYQQCSGQAVAAPPDIVRQPLIAAGLLTGLTTVTLVASIAWWLRKRKVRLSA